MSVVIIGGHDRMVRQYKEICENHKYKAKVFTQMKTGLDKLIGRPDLLILLQIRYPTRWYAAYWTRWMRTVPISSAVIRAAEQHWLKSSKSIARDVQKGGIRMSEEIFGAVQKLPVNGTKKQVFCSARRFSQGSNYQIS